MTKFPDITTLEFFGSTAFVHIPKEERRKLDAKSKKCVFVGYSSTQKAWRFWDPVARAIIVSRDATFIELESGDDPVLAIPTEIPAEDAEDAAESGESIPQLFEAESGESIPQLTEADQRPHRTRRPPEWMRSGDFILENTTSALLSDTDGTPTYRSALCSPEADHWKDATNKEFESLIENKTWTLVKRPPGRAVVKSGLVLKKKPGPEGKSYKARLVAKGYSQVPGRDFNETFSPVAKLDSIRTVLAIIAAQNLEAAHVDAKNAFLNGILEEEIYMEQPEGFIKPEDSGMPTNQKPLRTKTVIKNLEHCRDFLYDQVWVSAILIRLMCIHT